MSFSIGDKVRVKYNNIEAPNLLIGDVGTIVEIEDGFYKINTPEVYEFNWLEEHDIELVSKKQTKTYKIGKFYDINDKETTNFNFTSTVDIDLHCGNMGIHYSVMSIVVRMEDGEVILTKEELENLVDKLNS